MNETIRLKIDVSKIDKNHLFQGKKGTYLDVTLIPTPGNKYGNSHLAVQDLGKEAREAGQKGEILGNAKIAKAGDKEGGSEPAGGGGQSNIPF